jgi:hypothetical protein
MKVAGFLLLVAGWVIALSAVALIPSPNARVAFVLAGMAVQILGLVLALRPPHTPARGDA